LTILIVSCNAQNIKQSKFDHTNFEQQVLSYEPTQKDGVSKEDFGFGVRNINTVKSEVKNNPENFIVTDYLNVLSGFLFLKESEENIEIAFEKFKNAEGSCQFFIFMEKEIEKDSKYDIIREVYNKELMKCKANSNREKVFDIVEYYKANNLDSTLIKKINRILIDDQKYRSESSSELQLIQKGLDKHNQKEIDSLFNVHKSYVGRTLVGEKFKDVMFLVIQHSNLKMMERYLPVIQKAVKEKEVDVLALKFLIDRYYGATYGYQIFGSQSGSGLEMADEKTRKEIEKKYGIK
jgi:hypothetical protein